MCYATTPRDAAPHWWLIEELSVNRHAQQADPLVPGEWRSEQGLPAQGRQAEVLAQGRARVLGAEHAALLQQRHDLVDELVEAARREVRDEDEAVARRRPARTRRSSSATVAGVPMKVCRPVTSMIRSRSDRFFASAQRPPLVRGGERVAVHPHAGPALGDRVLADDAGRRRAAGRRGRSRTGRGSTAAPANLIAVCAADLLAADLVGLLAGPRRRCRRARTSPPGRIFRSSGLRP